VQLVSAPIAHTEVVLLATIRNTCGAGAVIGVVVVPPFVVVAIAGAALQP
jgi:hypothetical protein